MIELANVSGVRRSVLYVVAALGPLAVIMSFVLLCMGPLEHWPLALLGMVSVIAVVACWIRVGNLRHRSPVISVPVVALPALVPVLPEGAVIGIIAIGVMVVFFVRTGVLSVALYSGGLAALGAMLAVGVARVAMLAGLPLSAVAALSCASYVVFAIAAEVIRMRARAPRDLKGKPKLMLSPIRTVMAIGGTALAGSWLAVRSEGGIPLLSEQGLTVHNTVALLLVLLTAVVAVKIAMKMAALRRRLNGLIAGASALSLSRQIVKTRVNDGASHEQTEAEAAARLGRKLGRVVAATIGVETVEIRDTPPGKREIGSTVSLRKDAHQYIVARRDEMDGEFTVDDRRCLIALARTVDVVAKGQRSIGGLTLRAKTDSLTMLPNYGAFQEALANINDNRAYAEAIAVLFIDLDDFKRLNDTYGHQTGDVMLRELGRRLTETVRPRDVVARVGGDEFVIILTQLSSLKAAQVVAQRIMDNAAEPFTINEVEFHPVISVGLAYSAHRETDLSELVDDADRAMLEIKRRKRTYRASGAHRTSSLNTAGHRSFELNDIVVRAIDEQLLNVVYQPIVNLVTGRIWAFEALVRYTDPEQGAIPPTVLVEKAKALGRLDALTVQVAEQAMAAAELFKQIDRSIACMTINIDAPQVLPDRMGSYVLELAERYSEITICLELNEGSLAMVSEPVRAHTEYLRDMGVMIAVDDYGSQDSSVDSLVRVPMDILKIDRGLVDDLDDIRQREVLTALQGFGDKLEYSMIVEGVENQSMADHLSLLGIRNAQGFHYGMPQPLAETIARLQEHGGAAMVPTVDPVLASTLEE